MKITYDVESGQTYYKYILIHNNDLIFISSILYVLINEYKFFGVLFINLESSARLRDFTEEYSMGLIDNRIILLLKMTLKPIRNVRLIKLFLSRIFILDHTL